MKNRIIITLLLSLFLTSFINTESKAQSSGEPEIYFNLRVFYSYKGNDVYCKLSANLGTSADHPLKGKIEEGDGGVLRFNTDDGKIVVFSNEVDCLNYLSKIGWIVKDVSYMQALERSYVQYLIVRKQ